MPILNFGGDGDGDLREQFAEMTKLLNFLLGGKLDSLNIRELTADKIITGTLLAQLVTIMSNLNGGAFIRIDGNGMVINDGSQNVFEADTNGNVTIEGIIRALGGIIGGWTIEEDRLSGNGTIEGGEIIGSYISTSDGTFPRIEFSSFSKLLTAYLNSGDYIAIDPDATGAPTFLFYIFNDLKATLSYVLGALTLKTFGPVDMELSVGANLHLKGSVKVNSGNALGSEFIPFSSATTVSELVDDFNDLVDALTRMKIVS